MVLWTFRRNENDVVNLYNTLSPVMQLATGGDMLNFGLLVIKKTYRPLAHRIDYVIRLENLQN